MPIFLLLQHRPKLTSVHFSSHSVCTTAYNLKGRERKRRKIICGMMDACWQTEMWLCGCDDYDYYICWMCMHGTEYSSFDQFFRFLCLLMWRSYLVSKIWIKPYPKLGILLPEELTKSAADCICRLSLFQEKYQQNNRGGNMSNLLQEQHRTWALSLLFKPYIQARLAFNSAIVSNKPQWTSQIPKQLRFVL